MNSKTTEEVVEERVITLKRLNIRQSLEWHSYCIYKKKFSPLFLLYYIELSWIYSNSLKIQRRVCILIHAYSCNGNYKWLQGHLQLRDLSWANWSNGMCCMRKEAQRKSSSFFSLSVKYHAPHWTLNTGQGGRSSEAKETL